MGAMGKIISKLSLLAMLALAASLSSCAMGGGDAMEQLLASGDTLFVAGGFGNTVYASSDGVIWTGPFTSNTGNFTGVTYGRRGFLSAGSDGTNAYAIISTNGYTWFPVITGLAMQPRGAGYGEGIYIIAANEGILTSYDGVNWGLAASTPTQQYCVVYGNGIYLVAGVNSVYRSIDGINWSGIDDPPTMTFNSGIFVEDTFYLVGNSGGWGSIVYSKDANSGSDNLIPTGFNSLNCVVHGEGIFIAGGDNAQMWISGNGIAWSYVNPAAAAGMAFRGIAHGGGRFVAVGPGSPYAIYSDDGINWFQSTPPPGGFQNLFCVTVRP